MRVGLLCFTAILGLSACGGSGTDDPSPDAGSNAEPQPAGDDAEPQSPESTPGQVPPLPHGELWLTPRSSSFSGRIHVAVDGSEQAVVSYDTYMVATFPLLKRTESGTQYGYETARQGSSLYQVSLHQSADGAVVGADFTYLPGNVCGPPFPQSDPAEVKPDTEETFVTREFRDGGAAAALPWHSIELFESKPTLAPFGASIVAQTADQKNVEFVLGTPPRRASIQLIAWPQLLGQTVTLQGTLANANGVGMNGLTAWKMDVQIPDFGPAVSGMLDFNAADAVMDGVIRDESCGTETDGSPRSCLMLSSPVPFLARFKGPLVDLRIHARASDPTSKMEITFATKDGHVGTTTSVPMTADPASADSAAPAFTEPVDEVLVAISAARFNPQTSAGCGGFIYLPVYINSIEPIAPAAP